MLQNSSVMSKFSYETFRKIENRKYTITLFTYEFTIQIGHQKYFYINKLLSHNRY